MKVVLLDVETTSLDPRTGQILELAAVAYDVAADKIVSRFQCTFKHEVITGQPYALAMNSALLYEIAGKDKDYQPVSLLKIDETLAMSPDMIWHLTCFEFVPLMQTWMRSLVDLQGWSNILLCGAQIGSFDYQFLLHVPSWAPMAGIEYRQVELGSLLMQPGDSKPFSVEKNLARLGLTAIGPVHRALPDCMNYVQLLKSWWNGGGRALDGKLDVGQKYDVEIVRHVTPVA